MIAPTCIIRGAGMTFGMEIVEVEGTTGYYDSNLEGKMVSAAQKFASSDHFDYGFVHIKAVDDAGHDKSRQIKIEQLEKSDQAIGVLI
jgi:2,3-bisphosphoglycerate-independent phosphoglycerate mutase